MDLAPGGGPLQDRSRAPAETLDSQQVRPGRGRAPESFVPTAELPSDPHALLEARERTDLVYRLLDELSEPLRTTFILFEIEGLSGAQIAEVTGTKVNAVWVRLSRARRKFMAGMRAWEERNKS